MVNHCSSKMFIARHSDRGCRLVWLSVVEWNHEGWNKSVNKSKIGWHASLERKSLQWKRHMWVWAKHRSSKSGVGLAWSIVCTRATVWVESVRLLRLRDPMLDSQWFEVSVADLNLKVSGITNGTRVEVPSGCGRRMQQRIETWCRSHDALGFGITTNPGSTLQEWSHMLEELVEILVACGKWSQHAGHLHML